MQHSIFIDCKEIKHVNPKGNQLWIFIGRTDTEAEAPIFWLPKMKNQLIRKDPNAGKDWRQEEKGAAEDEIVRWHQWLKTSVWANSKSWWRTEELCMLQSMGLQRVRHNWATEQQSVSHSKYVQNSNTSPYIFWLQLCLNHINLFPVFYNNS